MPQHTPDGSNDDDQRVNRVVIPGALFCKCEQPGGQQIYTLTHEANYDPDISNDKVKLRDANVPRSDTIITQV